MTAVSVAPSCFRDALANSYNIPPVQLAARHGAAHLYQHGPSMMGVESLREPPGYYGLALTLGGGEVTLLEMTHSYATLANRGQRPRLTGVLQITTAGAMCSTMSPGTHPAGERHRPAHRLSPDRYFG
jgi:membrane carboxypeptidase/penicillin-binding protein PbpC